MAKVIDPENDFIISRTSGKLIELRNRKEGKVVSAKSLKEKLKFFDLKYNPIVNLEITEAWNNLDEEEKQSWNDIAEPLYMDGETYFKIKEQLI